MSNLTASNLQHTENQERNDQCGNQHPSRELLMMGTVVPETFWAYKKYNKIISGIYLVFYSTVISDARSNKHQTNASMFNLLAPELFFKF